MLCGGGHGREGVVPVGGLLVVDLLECRGHGALCGHAGLGRLRLLALGEHAISEMLRLLSILRSMAGD